MVQTWTSSSTSTPWDVFKRSTITVGFPYLGQSIQITLSLLTRVPVRGYRQGRTPWMDPSIYPVQENLIHGAETGSDAPFLVDIAGGLGHDLTEFKRRFPNTPGVSDTFPLQLVSCVWLTKDIEILENLPRRSPCRYRRHSRSRLDH